MAGRRQAGAAPGGNDAAEAREALRLSNERMGTLLESITDGFLGLDRAWRINYINARADAMLRPPGAQRGALQGRDLWQALPELRGSVLEAQYRHALERQESVSFELYHLPLKRWLEVRAYPSGEGLTSYLQDITQRKADERALREGAERLQVALAAGQLGDWSWDAASDLITLGWRAAEMLELPRATPLSWHALRARLHEDDRETARLAYAQLRASHGDYQLECRALRSDGTRRWLSIVGHASYGDDGALLGLSGMLRDITPRKAAEDTLRQGEQELRALADSIPQLAWIAHADGTMSWYNQRWYDYTGTTPEQAIGAGWQAPYDSACLEQMLARWERSLRSGDPFEMEFPIRGADGQFRWFLTRANPVRDGAGRLLRWFGTSTDVDQVKRVQEALREESTVLELLNSTGTALAATLDLRALLQEASDAATRISGARCGALLYCGGAAPLTALSGSDAAALLPGAPAAAPPLLSRLAVPVVSRSGQRLGTLLLGHPEAAVFGARTERIVGGIAAQAAVAIDNTRLYEAAQQDAEERKVLLDSERSARAEAEHSNHMKDEFLATLSHELRTPLSAILGWAQVLRRGTRDPADLQRGLLSIERNARAQAQLIEDLLDMSRITAGKVLLDIQTVAPASVIEAAIEALRPAAEAKNIRLESDCGAEVGAIAGDPGRLQQVIWNLLSNALKFTPKDGAVCIAARRLGPCAEISVSDSGIGIRAEFLAHVFERFRQADASTTRKHGGLGLGLAIVKHLVEQHGGTVAVSSPGEGLGATFTLLLPLAAAGDRAPRDAAQVATPPEPAQLTATRAGAGQRDAR